MTSLQDYLKSDSSPTEKPALDQMDASTQELHEGIDNQIRETKEPYLHPEGPTVQVDLFGSAQMIAWQEQKGARTMIGEECWSDLPQVYGRYATTPGNEVIAALKTIENAAGIVLTDCGMQATAIVQDVLLKPDSHAIMSRQVYNKSKAYLNWATERMEIENTIVEELTVQTLRDNIRPNTTFIFAETFANPLMDALDLNALSDAVVELRESSRGIRFVVDNTIVTPWGVKKPLLDYPGIDVIVSAGTKAMGGQDRDMWGYIASNGIDFLNQAMDIQAMRGGILSWRSADSVKESMASSESRFSKRCHNAKGVVEFLEAHPLIEEVFHPTASTYRHASIFAEQYKLGGSLLSFRINDLDEDQTGHFCDVLAMTIPFRYALSFDGLVSKVNHHKSVSEYYTPPPLVKKQGINRLARLGVGCEEAEDLIACLNWALWNHHKISHEDVRQSQRDRIESLGLEVPAALKDDDDE